MWRIVRIDEQYYVMDLRDEEKFGPYDSQSEASEILGYMLSNGVH